ncbi:Uncharacterised protein [Burkholderia pseudomallei]|nr:Uncharacterised protein [Burkholderia pseudomallei]CAJ7882836.1 Uncharacterised protein [Burkholderia pseudomallei]
MTKILSREEVERLWHNSNNDGTLCSQLMSFSAALESALLEKLWGEPVAWMHEKAEMVVIGGNDKRPFGKGFIPLYALNRSKA